MRGVVLFGIVALVLAAGSASAELSDAQVRQEIIRGSIAAYKATGHPCACPFDLMRNGAQCGDRRAYSRPGGAAAFRIQLGVSFRPPLNYLGEYRERIGLQRLRDRQKFQQINPALPVLVS